MISRSTQMVKQIWTRNKKIAKWVLILFLLETGQGAAVKEAEILTATQNAQLLYSECSNVSTQKLKLEKFQSVHDLSFDFVESVKDIASIILELGKQEIQVIEQSKVAMFDCELKALCINAFSLKALLKAQPKLNRAFITDFISVNAQQLMYLRNGQSKFIEKKSFKHFARSNIEITLQNITSHLLYIETDKERKLTNTFHGQCYCKLCNSLKNLKLKQLAVKKYLKRVVSEMLELWVGLQMALPNDIKLCLRNFLEDKSCMYNYNNKVRRSIFSSSDHDDLRRVTKIFEKNFENIIKHERAKKLELNAIHRKLGAEEIDLQDLRNFMRGSQVIEKIHKIQVDFYLLFSSNLDILQKNLETADFVNLLDLFKTNDCRFLDTLHKCVFLDNFHISGTWIHANFRHSTYQLSNFSMFSCYVKEFGGNFYVNDLHNRILRPKEVEFFNKTRPIRSSDFVVQNVGIIATRNIIENGDCYTMFCVSSTSYKGNGTLMKCDRGDSKVWCGQFMLEFAEGSISHLNLASHITRAERIGSVAEDFYHRIPDKIQEQTVEIEEEDTQLVMDTEEASSWLLKEDLIQILGVGCGTFVFILAALGVIYLKCKKRGGTTLIVPSFKADTGAVTLNRGGFRQNYEQFSQPEPDNPASPPAPNTSQDYTASAPTEVVHKRVERKHTRQQSLESSSKGSKRSLVTQTFRTK